MGLNSFINPAAPSWIGPIEAEVELDPAGPLRNPTPRLTRGVVLAGHSPLQPGNNGNILRDAVGPVMSAGISTRRKMSGTVRDYPARRITIC